MCDKHDYRRLVEDLRVCASSKADCDSCSRLVNFVCSGGLKRDAADAIEALSDALVVANKEFERLRNCIAGFVEPEELTGTLGQLIDEVALPTDIYEQVHDIYSRAAELL